MMFVEVDLAKDITPCNQLVVSDFIHADMVIGYEVAKFVVLSMY